MFKLLLILLLSNFLLACGPVNFEQAESGGEIDPLYCSDWGGFLDVELVTNQEIPENYKVVGLVNGEENEIFNSCNLDSEKNRFVSVSKGDPNTIQLSSGGFGGAVYSVTDYKIYEIIACDTEPVEFASFTNNTIETVKSGGCWFKQKGLFVEDNVESEE